MYYRVIRSLDELVGAEGVLRLPSYIFDIFVADDVRSRVLREAYKLLLKGERVLITGLAGTGKTTLMAVLLRNLFEGGFNIGYILYDSTYVGRDHEKEGVIVFFDDIVRLNKAALKSIVKHNVGSLVATVRLEELKDLESKLGTRVRNVFKVLRIEPMEEKYLKQILLRMAEKEGVTVEEDAVSLIIAKSGSLPIYIWQVMRDLKVQRKKTLDASFAKRIPEGMLEYVDGILWRILQGQDDKYEILATLRIMTDMPNYEMHQDLMSTVYAVVRSRIRKTEVDLKSALFSTSMDRVSRYLIKTSSYTFKLPHDSWADVLMGKSKGLISPDIAKINTLFTIRMRQEILHEASRLCDKLVMSRVEDPLRKEAFYRQLKFLGIAIGKESVDSLKLIFEVLTSEEEDLRRKIMEVKDTKSLISKPREHAKYFVASLIYHLLKDDTRRLTRLRNDLEELMGKIREEDAYVLTAVYDIAVSNPEKAIFHLKKTIDVYGGEKAENLVRLLLLKIPPRCLSDIILATYWASPELFDEIFITNRDEFLYITKNISIDELARELRDVFKYEKELAVRIINSIMDILKGRILEMPLSKRIEALNALFGLPKTLKSIIIEALEEIILLPPNELLKLGDKIFASYMGMLRKSSPELLHKLFVVLFSENYIDTLKEKFSKVDAIEFLDIIDELIVTDVGHTFILEMKDIIMKKVEQMDPDQVIKSVRRFRSKIIPNPIVDAFTERFVCIAMKSKPSDVSKILSRVLKCRTALARKVLCETLNRLMKSLDSWMFESLLLSLMSKNPSTSVFSVFDILIDLLIKHAEAGHHDAIISAMIILNWHGLLDKAMNEKRFVETLNAIPHINLNKLISLLIGIDDASVFREVLKHFSRAIKNTVEETPPAELSCILRDAVLCYGKRGEKIAKSIMSIAKGTKKKDELLRYFELVVEPLL